MPALSMTRPFVSYVLLTNELLNNSINCEVGRINQRLNKMRSITEPCEKIGQGK
jgi:hypothetical protein